MKMESSGFPKHVQNQEEKEAHVQQLNEGMEGLGLQVHNVVRNEARRTFAKNMSNCGLGKVLLTLNFIF